MTLDINKPVQTRDGRKARILCKDFKRSRYPLLAAITARDGEERLQFYTKDGLYLDGGCPEHECDLVNVPEEKVLYLNVYQYGSGGEIVYGTGGFHCSLQEANANAAYNLHCGLLKLTLVGGFVTKAEVL